jgi:hypothetical protein
LFLIRLPHASCTVGAISSYNSGLDEPTGNLDIKNQALKNSPIKLNGKVYPFNSLWILSVRALSSR